MKIGILTHQYINNYGAFLQAWALRKAISELFPEDEVQIIDYVNVKHYIINAGGWFRFYKNRETLKEWFAKVQLPNTFAKARNQEMVLSKRCFNARQINELEFDCIVVGSDEVWNYRDTKGNAELKFGVGLTCKNLIAYVGYFVEEGLLGGIACFSLFYSLLKSSWKKATFKNSRNMNNSFFLCFVSYVAVMLSVADVSQLLWVIIALYIIYNAKAQAIVSE